MSWCKLTINLLFLAMILPMGACGPKVANTSAKGSNIICFGDSLTAGYGAKPGEDYPAVLSKLLGQPVINAGSSGNTTRQALERLETDVLDKDPKLVIVQFGANDFFRKIPKNETRDNLDQIVLKIQEKGAMVAIAGVRIGLLVDEYDEVFERVASDRKCIYIPNIIKDIFTDPSKKSDEIHPNASGYGIIAQRVYNKIKPYILSVKEKGQSVRGSK
ncbi:MAG: arylesterase [bacterium]|nr:arylesterase [bacterium]MDD5756692.1 arylesterase [bacterium]